MAAGAGPRWLRTATNSTATPEYRAAAECDGEEVRGQVSPTARQLGPGLGLMGPPPAMLFPLISQIVAWPLVF